GPRGTGLVWASREVWPLVQPTIPTFDRMWRSPPSDQMPPGGLNTPGGFHSFEHRWAVTQAFEFHRAIGKARVANRVHSLNSMAKAAMATMPKVRIHTPMSADLSAGIIAFEVTGLTPDQVVEKLHHQGIIASVTPRFYNPSLARVAPSLLTLEDDVERTMRAIAAL
ncbi:MAG: aminotransferase class V-fold PLP-dependent enzyme, partial [Sphingomicrobium sp.]